MNDSKISTNTALAALLWTAGLTLVLVGLFSDFDSGELGLMCSGAAMVFNIRGFLCELARREREAFEFGREIGEESARGIRPLR